MTVIKLNAGILRIDQNGYSGFCAFVGSKNVAGEFARVNYKERKVYLWDGYKDFPKGFKETVQILISQWRDAEYKVIEMPLRDFLDIINP